MKIRQVFSKLVCFLLGHDMIEEGTYDNGKSMFGGYRCLRCGREHAWQYDR